MLQWSQPSWWRELCHIVKWDAASELHCAPNFAKSEYARLEVRRYILQQWSSLSESSEAILNLQEPPQAEDLSISISHSRDLVGVLVASSPWRMGLDIELPSRVSMDIVERVSRPEDLVGIPSPAHLWTAKEALYKALAEEHRPLTGEPLRIENWQQLAEDTWSFEGWSELQAVDGDNNLARVEGVVKSASPFLIAACRGQDFGPSFVDHKPRPSTILNRENLANSLV